jgi:UDP-N-acetylmuramoyl-tripeptide--D-alanyl-D-alanine ligase
MKKTLNDIARWLDADQTFDDITVTGVSINTRTLQKGDLFIPFRGENANGHKYVAQAFEAGAAAAFWQKDEPNPPKDFPLIFVDDAEEALQQMARAYRAEHQATFIAVTGSNGKTSTKDLIAGTLKPYYKVQKTEGNYNNQLGLPLTLLGLDEDTQFAVLEMGMDGFGQIELLTKMAKPHYAVITNIGEAHMEALGSREGIAKAKFEITMSLQADGKFFYDGDEPLLTPLVEAANLNAISFGLEASDDLYATNITETAAGSTFNVHGLLEDEFFISVLGRHQVKNTLIAILIAQDIGLTNDQIREALKGVQLTNMRMQLIEGKNDVLFINDAYNAAPTSVRAALNFVEHATMRRDKWVVLGDMLELGTLEREYHENIADDLNVEAIHHVCLFGPRMEALYAKLQGKVDVIWSADDYAPIIAKLEAEASAESLVLLKGSRGMALENVLNAFTK